MHASLIRRQLGGLIPPKIATPSHLVSPSSHLTVASVLFYLIFSQSGGSGEGLSPLVNFYSKLPKGAAPAAGFGGIKSRFFNGKNASSLPLWATILGIFGLGYTIDYQSMFGSVLNTHPWSLTFLSLFQCTWVCFSSDPPLQFLTAIFFVEHHKNHAHWMEEGEYSSENPWLLAFYSGICVLVGCIEQTPENPIVFMVPSKPFVRANTTSRIMRLSRLDRAWYISAV